MRFFNFQEQAQKNQRILDKINSPITCTDILVKPYFGGKNDLKLEENGLAGEYAYKSPYAQLKTSRERIVDHIRLLTALAFQAHCEKNCDMVNGTVIIKKGHENKLTRLLFYEYSFFTQGCPLSASDFEWLLTELEEIAKSKIENFQLVLGSFALQVSKDEICNLVLVVECGCQPKITRIAKNFTENDLPYNNFKYVLCRFYEISSEKWDASKCSKSATDSSEQVIKSNLHNVNIVKLYGGGEYWSVIEICCDHKFAIAKANFNKLSNEAVLLPRQAFHLLISNWIEKNSRNGVTEIFSADPLVDYSSKSLAPTSFKLQNPDFLKEICKAYAELNVHEGHESIVIECPPFGRDIQLIKMPELKLPLLHKEFLELVNKNNQKILGFIPPQFQLPEPNYAFGKVQEYQVIISSQEFDGTSDQENEGQKCQL